MVVTYSLLTIAFLGAFWVCPNVGWMQWLCVAAVGFGLYGPQMLIGLCGAEVVPKFAVSAAQGFLGWISYLGASPLLRSALFIQSSSMQLWKCCLELVIAAFTMYNVECLL